MAENSARPDRFIDELTASLSQRSGAAALRRINSERMLQLEVEDIATHVASGRIRVIADERLNGGEGADILLQIDDYDIRIELLDGLNDRPNISPQMLPRYRKLLAENPNTIALILVWTTDDLLSVPLSLRRVSALSETPDLVRGVTSLAKPLRDVLSDLFSLQVREWDAQLESLPVQTGEALDLRQEFAKALRSTVERECSRSYRDTERRRAAADFPIDSEMRVLLDTLDRALAGDRVDSLVAQLTHISRRGGR